MYLACNIFICLEHRRLGSTFKYCSLFVIVHVFRSFITIKTNPWLYFNDGKTWGSLIGFDFSRSLTLSLLSAVFSDTKIALVWWSSSQLLIGSLLTSEKHCEGVQGNISSYSADRTLLLSIHTFYNFGNFNPRFSKMAKWFFFAIWTSDCWPHELLRILKKSWEKNCYHAKNFDVKYSGTIWRIVTKFSGPLSGAT